MENSEIAKRIGGRLWTKAGDVRYYLNDLSYEGVVYRADICNVYLDENLEMHVKVKSGTHLHDEDAEAIRSEIDALISAVTEPEQVAEPEQTESAPVSEVHEDRAMTVLKERIIAMCPAPVSRIVSKLGSNYGNEILVRKTVRRMEEAGELKATVRNLQIWMTA